METISFERVSSHPSAKGCLIREASPTEMIYIATGTTVVSRSRLAGSVSREQFEQAVRQLEASYDILRSAVKARKFVQRVDNNSSIASWLSSKTTTVEALYEQLLNTDLDTSVGVYKIYVIVAADSVDILLLSSHAVTDATSLIELHACLAYMCDCVVRDDTHAVKKQSFPDPIDDAVRDALTSVSANSAAEVAASSSGAFAEIPLRGPIDRRPLKHRLERIVIGAETARFISTAGHANGSSVHALLLAAFAIAIRDAAPDSPNQILLRSNVDLRRRLEPHVSTNLVFSAISACVTPIDQLDRPLFDIARQIFDDIHRACADGRVLREYINYPASFGAPQQEPVALSVSDMQNVRFRWKTERLRVDGFEYALGWQKKFPNVSVAVFEGKLVANIVYVEEFVDPTIMRAISENVVRLLVSACDANERN